MTIPQILTTVFTYNAKPNTRSPIKSSSKGFPGSKAFVNKFRMSAVGLRFGLNLGPHTAFTAYKCPFSTMYSCTHFFFHFSFYSLICLFEMPIRVAYSNKHCKITTLTIVFFGHFRWPRVSCDISPLVRDHGVFQLWTMKVCVAPLMRPVQREGERPHDCWLSNCPWTTCRSIECSLPNISLIYNRKTVVNLVGKKLLALITEPD